MDEWSRFVRTLQELKQQAVEREEESSLGSVSMTSPLRWTTIPELSFIDRRLFFCDQTICLKVTVEVLLINSSCRMCRAWLCTKTVQYLVTFKFILFIIKLSMYKYIYTSAIVTNSIIRFKFFYLALTCMKGFELYKMWNKLPRTFVFKQEYFVKRTINTLKEIIWSQFFDSFLCNEYHYFWGWEADTMMEKEGKVGLTSNIFLHKLNINMKWCFKGVLKVSCSQDLRYLHLAYITTTVLQSCHTSPVVVLVVVP